ncbi:MAG TPA: hypothetical protein PL182_00425 [Pseudobdellovibrionaceae bacterium]|nr:hypothetical protein [Pseudobdellovibrionaceae bacterium]
MLVFLRPLLSVSLSASPVLAQEPATLADSYLRETKKVLQTLKQHDVDAISCRSFSGKDCLTPDDLLAALENKTVQFTESQDFTKPDGATRWSAFYETATGKVHLNSAVPHEEDTKGFVGLHEVLGAAGRPENEYHISKAAMVLSKVQDGTFSRLSPGERQSALDALRSQIAKPSPLKRANRIDDANSLLLKEGGGTAVGGGGDGAGIAQRILFARFLMESWAKSSISGRLPIQFSSMDIAIEVIDSDSTQIDYVMSDKEHIGWPVKILVPRSMTQQKPVLDIGAPNRAVEDIALYFGSLNPGLFFPQISFSRKFYRNKRNKVLSYPTYFSIAHPDAIRNFYRIQYDKLCAEGCEYLGTQ